MRAIGLGRRGIAAGRPFSSAACCRPVRVRPINGDCVMAKLNSQRSLWFLAVVGIAFGRLMLPVVAARTGQTGPPADAPSDSILAGSKVAFTGDREGQSL